MVNEKIPLLSPAPVGNYTKRIYWTCYHWSASEFTAVEYSTLFYWLSLHTRGTFCQMELLFFLLFFSSSSSLSPFLFPFLNLFLSSCLQPVSDFCHNFFLIDFVLMKNRAAKKKFTREGISPSCPCSFYSARQDEIWPLSICLRACVFSLSLSLSLFLSNFNIFSPLSLPRCSTFDSLEQGKSSCRSQTDQWDSTELLTFALFDPSCERDDATMHTHRHIGCHSVDTIKPTRGNKLRLNVINRLNTMRFNVQWMIYSCLNVQPSCAKREREREREKINWCDWVRKWII